MEDGISVVDQQLVLLGRGEELSGTTKEPFTIMETSQPTELMNDRTKIELRPTQQETAVGLWGRTPGH